MSMHPTIAMLIVGALGANACSSGGAGSAVAEGLGGGAKSDKVFSRNMAPTLLPGYRVDVIWTADPGHQRAARLRGRRSGHRGYPVFDRSRRLPGDGAWPSGALTTGQSTRPLVLTVAVT
jgi:hypothetical protein